MGLRCEGRRGAQLAHGRLVGIELTRSGQVGLQRHGSALFVNAIVGIDQVGAVGLRLGDRLDICVFDRIVGIG